MRWRGFMMQMPYNTTQIHSELFWRESIILYDIIIITNKSFEEAGNVMKYKSCIVSVRTKLAHRIIISNIVVSFLL